MQRLKSRLCLVLAFSLLLVFPVRTVITAETTPVPVDPTKPTLYVDYLGDSAAGPSATPSPPALTSADIGKVIWIGVSIEDIWKLQLVKNVGAYNLDVGLEYNPAVLQPAALSGGTLVAYDTVADATQAESGWLDAIEMYNFKDGVDAKDLAYWNSGQYTLMREASIGSADAIDEDFREYAIDKRTKLSFVALRKTTPNASTNRFVGVNESNTGHYSLIKMPFVIKSIPASGNPLMLSLSPSTFVMGADANGWEGYGAWEWYAARNEDDAPENNLKWMFNLAAPLNLFNTVDAALNGLEVWGNNETTGANEKLPMYSDTGMTTTIDFDPDVYDYYVNVPNRQRAVDIYLSATDPPVVTLNNLDYVDPSTVTVDTTLDTADNLYKTDCRAAPEGADTDLTVVKLSAGQTIADSFQNHFVISIGGSAYNVYVRRLDNPRIELAYGNSPYGMIMRDENILPENKQKAKERFNAGSRGTMNMFNPQTAAEIASDGVLVPSDANPSIRYNAKAWFDILTEEYLPEEELNDSSINMDRNDTALFVYNWEAFRDPGFIAYNSLGENVTDQVIRTITFDQANGGVSGTDILKDENVHPIFKRYTNTDGLNYTDITVYGEYMIRPKKYTMKYSFHDPILKQDIAPERYVIVLLYLGDTNFDGSVNLTDRGELERANKESSLSGNLIYNFRVADTNFDSYVNLTDKGELERANKEGTVTYMYHPVNIIS